jgi:ornithine cyclodeaminase/alanine dehydrogenase-like protein (mu-crystallin family)
MREVDARTLERADLVVQRSDVQPTFHFADGRGPVEAGEVVEPDAAKTVTLAEVVAGRAGRTSPEQITIFTGGSAGLGTQFAAVAHAVFTAARDAGVGRELPMEWFTQEEKP